MKSTQRNKLSLAVRDVVLIAVMVTALEAVKIGLSFLPNVELVTLLIVLYTRFFKEKILYVIPVFLVLETFQWGLGLWTIMYAYIWFILAFFTYVFRRQNSVIFWAALTGAFGLLFGALCALVYLFAGGPSMAFAWWISGLPFDFLHCVSNAVLTLVLFKPLDMLFRRMKTRYFPEKPVEPEEKN